jgi:hypothetical protein
LWLKIDIIEVNKLLWYLYSLLLKGAFNNDDIEVVEGIEKYNKILLLKEYKLI